MYCIPVQYRLPFYLPQQNSVGHLNSLDMYAYSTPENTCTLSIHHLTCMYVHIHVRLIVHVPCICGHICICHVLYDVCNNCVVHMYVYTCTMYVLYVFFLKK